MRTPPGTFPIEQLHSVRQHAGFEELSGISQGRWVSIGLTAEGQFGSDAAALAFAQAARKAMPLAHPHIAQTLAVDVTGPRQLLVQWERFPGVSLESLLLERGAFLPDDAVTIVLSVAAALEAAHALGLAHGALGPEWVTVIRDPTGLLDVKLGGFGMAMLGDVCAGRAPQPANDVLALSALLHQMLLGSARPNHELGQLPPFSLHLAPLLTKGLMLDGSGGFPSVTEFASALQQANRTRISGGTVKPATKGGLESAPQKSLGQWDLIELIGEGAMGRVFLGRHKVLERQAAIKVLRAEQYGREDLIQRFLQEARSVSQIHHEHIVEIFDFGQEVGADGKPSALYFVMELLKGETLTRRISRSALPLERIIHVTRQITFALSAAHHLGVVHRDLKPDNIFLINRKGDSEFVKVLDFGVAKLMNERLDLPTVSTVEGSIVGTPQSMSPEQASGDDVDHRTDVYAIGVLLYQMLAGKLPFEADNFVKLVKMVWTQPPPPLPPQTPQGEPIPPALARLTMQCLHKDAALRPQSMAALRETLDSVHLTAGESGRASTTNQAPTGAQREKGKARLWGALFGAAVAVALAVVAVGLRPQAASESSMPAVAAVAEQGVPKPKGESEAKVVEPTRPPVALPVPTATAPEDEIDGDADAGAMAAVQPPIRPQVSVKPAKPVTLTQEMLQAIVVKDRHAVLDCLERHRALLPKGAGEVRLRWTLETSGEVSHVEVGDSALNGTPLDACLRRAVKAFRFPKNAGPPRKMNVPFMYSGGTAGNP